MPFEVVTLKNGDRAIRDQLSGEVMHPSVGPWAEARALYVEQTGLEQRLRLESPEPVRIWDVGLGGAANAVAALACAVSMGAERRRALEIVSFEVDLQPLQLALADEAGFPFLAPWAEAARALCERGEWEGEGLRWRLLLGDARAAFASAEAGSPELVFHDPFSPETNPTMWSPEAFEGIRRRCRADGAGCLLVTYSASTRTRVSMLLGGFFVGVGRPIGTKKETTAAATRVDLLEQPLDSRWLERWRRSTSRAPWGQELDAGMEDRVATHAQFSASRRLSSA